MKVANYIVEFLKSKNVKCFFGYQGGNITHLIDAIARDKDLKYLQNYHEQASAFAANSYAEINNTIGVALSSSGPGATNLISGIANAYFDSIPCIFITGQTSTTSLHFDHNVRQCAFQETDIVKIVEPITKYCKIILEASEIPLCLEKAYYTAMEGRPGPVLLDIPHNIQTQEIESDTIASKFEKQNDNLENDYIKSQDFNSDIDKAMGLILSAERPLILLGGGAKKLKQSRIIQKILDKFSIPVVSSLRGLDILDHLNEYYFGFIGDYGNRYANLAVRCCDLLIVIGSRLDPRQTGSNLDEFAPNAKIIHIDIDSYELNRVMKEEFSILGDSLDIMKTILDRPIIKQTRQNKWIDFISHIKNRYPDYVIGSKDTYPNYLLNCLSELAAENTIICTDVGQNLMWTAQSFRVQRGQQFLCSAGHGAMGYALPAAIGAYMSSKSPIICIAGDGGIQMNIQELQTVSSQDMNIKIFIMNNNSLGLIRTYHEKYFDNRTIGSLEGFSSPDYEKLSSAYGMGYYKIRDLDSLYQYKNSLMKEEAAIYEVILGAQTQVVPEPAARKSVFDQYPCINEQELQEILEETQ